MLGIVRLRPSAEGKDTLRAMLTDQLDPAGLDGIISMHLIESDPELSRPINEAPSTVSPGAGDWYVLIDGTHVSAVSAIVAARFADAAGFNPATRDFNGHLQSDVGFGEERHPDLNPGHVKYQAYIALPHERHRHLSWGSRPMANDN